MCVSVYFANARVEYAKTIVATPTPPQASDLQEFDLDQSLISEAESVWYSERIGAPSYGAPSSGAPSYGARHLCYRRLGAPSYGAPSYGTLQHTLLHHTVHYNTHTTVLHHTVLHQCSTIRQLLISIQKEAFSWVPHPHDF